MIEKLPETPKQQDGWLIHTLADLWSKTNEVIDTVNHISSGGYHPKSTESSHEVDNTQNCELDTLCRGKLPCSGKWLIGSYVQAAIVSGIIPLNATELSPMPIIPDTRGEYIGIQLHGDKIFTGDLLADTDGILWENVHDEYIAQVHIYEVVRDGYRFKLQGFYDSSYDNPDDAFFENIDRFTLVGNKWDNPELLSNIEA